MYSAFYDLLLSDSIYFDNIYTLTTNDFLTPEVFWPCIKGWFSFWHAFVLPLITLTKWLIFLTVSAISFHPKQDTPHCSSSFLPEFFCYLGYLVFPAFPFWYSMPLLCLFCHLIITPFLFFLLRPIFVCPFCSSLWMKLPSDQGIMPRLCSSTSPARWWDRQQTSNVPSWHLTPWVCVPCHY